MRVALYLRLSDEDHDKFQKEELSESIKNQENMLKDYALENNWEIVGIYQDEDYSGADKDRPNFNKMIRECEKRNIDIVLVKTQSRFARDIELIDKYVHNLFYEWNIRFITYLEQIDNTRKETKKTSQITSMVDEWYLEDTSNNIKATLRTKRLNGEFTGSFTPYGYQKDPNNKNQLLIDPVVAPTIQRIYKEFINGYSLSKIANHLNTENILSPLEYKRLTGSKLQIPITKKYENYPFLIQTGSYLVNIHYCNIEKEAIHNLITYLYLNISSNIELTLLKYSNDILQIYYTTKFFKEQSFPKTNWEKVKTEMSIPCNCKGIAIKTKKLLPNETLFLQFLFHIKENKTHQKHYFIFHHYLQQKKISLDFQINYRKQYKWSIQTIKNILSNEIYIGNLVQFKTTHVSYKNHTLIHNPPSKQIKVSHTHKAIIDIHTWNQAQLKLKNCLKGTKKGKIHPLSNKLFCSECSQKFMKCGKSNKEGYSYFCCRDKLHQWKNCNNNKYFPEKVLYDILLKHINQFIKNYLDEEEFLKLSQQFPKKDTSDKEEYHFLLQELQNKNHYFTNLYESYTQKLLTKQEFLTLKEKYIADIVLLKNRIHSIENAKPPKKKAELSIPQKIKEMDSLFIDTFIDKIIIFPFHEKEKLRTIKILWNLKIKN